MRKDAGFWRRKVSLCRERFTALTLCLSFGCVSARSVGPEVRESVALRRSQYSLAAPASLFVPFVFTNRSSSTVFLSRCGYRRATHLLRQDAGRNDTLPAPICWAVLMPPDSVRRGESISDSVFVGPVVGFPPAASVGRVRLILDAYRSETSARNGDLSALVADSLRQSAVFLIVLRR
jgi:hypothetical protein